MIFSLQKLPDFADTSPAVLEMALAELDFDEDGYLQLPSLQSSLCIRYVYGGHMPTPSTDKRPQTAAVALYYSYIVRVTTYFYMLVENLSAVTGVYPMVWIFLRILLRRLELDVYGDGG